MQLFCILFSRMCATNIKLFHLIVIFARTVPTRIASVPSSLVSLLRIIGKLSYVLMECRSPVEESEHIVQRAIPFLCQLGRPVTVADSTT